MAVLWLAPVRAMAGHPFETDDSGTQGAMGASLEYAAGLSLGTDGEVTPALGVGIQLGLLDSLDLGMALTVDFEGAGPAVTGPDVGLKWRMLGEATGPSLGLRVDYGIAGELAAVALLSLVAEETAVHINFGAGADVFAVQSPWQLRAGVTASSLVASSVSVGVEMCATTSSDGAEQTVRLALGGSWGFTDRLTLTGGVWGVAYSDSAGELGAGLALTAIAAP